MSRDTVPLYAWVRWLRLLCGCSILSTASACGQQRGDVFTSVPDEPPDVTGVDPPATMDAAAPESIDADNSMPTAKIDSGLPRAAPEPVALYLFDEGQGEQVLDQSGYPPRLDLAIADPTRVTWTNDGVRLDMPTRIASVGFGVKIWEACEETNEFSLEAWIIPSVSFMTGPGRIVALSQHSNAFSFVLGQGGEAGEMADIFTQGLRTQQTDLFGDPRLDTPAGSAVANQPTHVMFTHDANGADRFYLDASLVAEGQRPGALTNWDNDHRIVIGNDIPYAPDPVERPWLGTVLQVAVYNLALTDREVAAEFDKGY